MTTNMLGQPAVTGTARGRFAGALLAAAAGFMLATPAHSASITYVLDQSNVFDDGVPYLQVTLSDGADGSVDFKVELLDALGQLNGNDHFGIQSFAFNIVGGTGARAHDVTGLPDHWAARDQRRMDGFGLFDVRVQGPGKQRVDELDFSITGVDLDTLLSYVDFSTGRAPQGQVYFAARVGGINAKTFGRCSQSGGMKPSHSSTSGGDDSEHESDDFDDDCHRAKGAYFGGPGSVVPVPASVWLFGTGLGLLGVVRRRISVR